MAEIKTTEIIKEDNAQVEQKVESPVATKVAKLIDLKSIVTLAMTACLCGGFAFGVISEETLKEFVMITFIFYFSKPTTTK